MNVMISAALSCATFKLNWMLYMGLLAQNQPLTYEQAQSIQMLNNLTLTTPTLIAEIIQKYNSPSYQLDPAPTFLLKHCTSVISAPIPHLNVSFISATVLISLKTAAVTVLKEKSNLDPADFTSYRLISNLPFISKI